MRLAAVEKNLPCLNALDEKSAMVLSVPAKWSGSREVTLRERCRRERNRSSRAAGMEVDEWRLCAHVTAEMLSQKLPMWQCSSDEHTHSRTSQPRRRAASSRSLMVI